MPSWEMETPGVSSPLPAKRLSFSSSSSSPEDNQLFIHSNNEEYKASKFFLTRCEKETMIV
jgi:hypothetical protein